MQANNIRINALRMIGHAGSGHPGGSLSCADILATLYFSGVMRYKRSNPRWEGRDRFVLSKGHAAPALYALFSELGWLREDEAATLRMLGSRLQGHPDSKLLPGIEVCTGSLGQGLSVGVGMALGLSIERHSDVRVRNVFVLCGDGELQEGSNWEALMYAAHRRLGNITLIIDANGLQIDGATKDVCGLGSLHAKLTAFGWCATEVDGHDIRSLYNSLLVAVGNREQPSAIICHTTKGKGVSFMEDNRTWHGIAPSNTELAVALQELGYAGQGASYD